MWFAEIISLMKAYSNISRCRQSSKYFSLALSLPPFTVHLPQEKAKTTRMQRRKNFIMSITIRPNEICSGPRYGLTENMYTSFKELQFKDRFSEYILQQKAYLFCAYLKIFAAANNPSAINMGSHASQSSRPWVRVSIPLASSLFTCKYLIVHFVFIQRDNYFSHQYSPYLSVSDYSKSYRSNVQRIRYEVQHVPNIADVFLQSNVPKLFYFCWL